MTTPEKSKLRYRLSAAMANQPAVERAPKPTLRFSIVDAMASKAAQPSGARYSLADAMRRRVADHDGK